MWPSRVSIQTGGDPKARSIFLGSERCHRARPYRAHDAHLSCPQPPIPGLGRSPFRSAFDGDSYRTEKRPTSHPAKKVMPSATQKCMSTVFPNPFNVNGSSAGLADDHNGRTLARMHARAYLRLGFDYTATLALLGPQPWDLDEVAQVTSWRFARAAADGSHAAPLASIQVRRQNSYARMTPNATAAATRLNLSSAHLDAIVALADRGYESVVDVAMGVRARLRCGCVMHIYRLRSRPRAPSARLRPMPISPGTHPHVAGMG